MNEMLTLIKLKCSFQEAPREGSLISSVIASKTEAIFAEAGVTNEVMVINGVEDNSNVDKIEVEADTEVEAMTTMYIRNTVDDHSHGTILQIVHAQDHLQPLVPHVTVDRMSKETNNVV